MRSPSRASDPWSSNHAGGAGTSTTNRHGSVSAKILVGVSFEQNEAKVEVRASATDCARATGSA